MNKKLTFSMIDILETTEFWTLCSHETFVQNVEKIIIPQFQRNSPEPFSAIPTEGQISAKFIIYSYINSLSLLH